MVGRELLGVAAEHVARELVEQDHRGQCGQGIAEKRLDRQPSFLRPTLFEPLADFFVDLRIAFPPLLGLQPKPVGQDVPAPVGHAVAVPPTVSPSISKVG